MELGSIVDDSISNINDLPPEMLAKIFAYLGKYSDRDRAGSVCPEWKSVIDETVGVRKWIGQGSEFWDTGSEKWKPLTEIQTSGISRCFFSDVTTGASTSASNDENLNLGFLRPNLVGHVELDGSIPQEMFESILKPLRKLRVLALHLSTLSLIDVQLSPYPLVQNLTKLCLTSEGFCKDDFMNYKMEPVYHNMIKLLEMHFPKLKTFHSSLPLFLDKEVELFSLFADFTIKHGTTLQEISLKVNYRWRINARNSNRRTTEEVLDINNRLDAFENRFKNTESSLPQGLQYLVLVIDDRRMICPSSLGIKATMFLQTKLVKLYYVCWDYISMPVSLISKNSTTLAEIGLTVNDIADGPVDCSVFTECRSLQKLLLEADGDVEFNNTATDAPRLQNPQALPKSLKSILFRNVYMESSSVETIAKGLPSLKSLFLTNIGKVDNLGMSLDCLLWILNKSPTIRKLKVKGLNEKSFRSYFSGYSTCTSGDETLPVGGAESFSEEEDDSISNSDLQEDSQSDGKDEQELLSLEDMDLLDGLMEETDMKTKFISYIAKKDGIWKRQYES